MFPSHVQPEATKDEREGSEDGSASPVSERVIASCHAFIDDQIICGPWLGAFGKRRAFSALISAKLGKSNPKVGEIGIGCEIA